MTKRVTASAYAKAGVNIDMMNDVLKRSKRMIRGTMTKKALGDWGSFGGLFASPGKEKALVSSIDGVGTKLKVALLTGRHNTVGQDLVNHCVNDILVQGAEPLFFLDYIGAANLDPRVFGQVIEGLCKACKENGCALLGGETAEMPGLYPEGEYDLVGTIIGMVDRKKMITGKQIRKGNVLIGLPSTGLHTNGFSLARQIIFNMARMSVDDTFPGTEKTVADVLLAVHRSYLKPVTKLMSKVKIHGMAHITGGGLVDNLPRILPNGLKAVVDRSTWKRPPVFKFLQQEGRVDRDEMYRVFNMGIGMVIIVSEREQEAALKTLKSMKAGATVIGTIDKGAKGVQLEN